MGAPFCTNHYKIYACLGTPATPTAVDHNQVLALRALADLRSFRRVTVILPILNSISAMSTPGDVYRKAALLWELMRKTQKPEATFPHLRCCRVLGDSLMIAMLALEGPLENQIYTNTAVPIIQPSSDLGFCSLYC